MNWKQDIIERLFKDRQATVKERLQVTFKDNSFYAAYKVFADYVLTKNELITLEEMTQLMIIREERKLRNFNVEPLSEDAWELEATKVVNDYIREKFHFVC